MGLDLDTNQLPVADAIKIMSKKTGYTFTEHPCGKGTTLDLQSKDPTSLHQAAQIHGMMRVEKLMGSTWRTLRLRPRRMTSVSTAKTTLSNSTIGPVIHEGEDENALISHGLSQTISNLGSDGAMQSRIEGVPVRISYDPRQVGARRILRHFQKVNPDLCLAPSVAPSSISTAKQQVKMALIMFLPTLALTILVIILAKAPINHKHTIYAHVSFFLATIVQSFELMSFIGTVFRSPWSV